MRIEFTPFGPPELVREDGWRYRLEGVLGLDWDIEYDDRWLPMTSVPGPRQTILTVTIASLNDETFESIKLLRDELTHCSIRLNHDF